MLADATAFYKRNRDGTKEDNYRKGNRPGWK